MAKRYWLMKSEPEVYSFTDLKKDKNQTTCWEGVRNYQARNLLRDQISVGDEVFFYHSRVDPMHIAGIAKVVRAGYPDPFQFDAKSKYFDSGSNPDDPRWYCVDLKYQKEFRRPVTLRELKSVPGLEDMVLTRKGSRLSVQPVSAEEWKIIVALSKTAAPREDGPSGKSAKRKPSGKKAPAKKSAKKVSAKKAAKKGARR